MKTTKTKVTRLDTTPTVRYVGKIPVSFYSPQQIEEIIPVEVRVAKSRGSNLTEHQAGDMHMKLHRNSE